MEQTQTPFEPMDTLLQDLDEYCRQTGLQASTICVRALGDSRFVARHRRRLLKIKSDRDRLREFMRANPPLAASVEDTVGGAV